ncbi:MAG TPA: hypothetical protein VMW50_10280 [Dehalococcoidia bacterium]|nr:hypothetical protein [Dehalococcoidia bacterium]
MANSKTQDSNRLWKIDTSGVISTTPVWIKKIILYPNAAGDSVLFKTWDENSSAKSTKYLQTTTTTANPYIQSTGNFTTTLVAAGDVIKVDYSSTTNNMYTYSVASRDSDNQITVDGYPAITAEASKTYSWRVWTPTEFAYLIADGTEKKAFELDWTASPKNVPNMFVDTLTASAVVYVYLY